MRLSDKEKKQLVVYDTRKEQPSIWNLQAFVIVFLFIMLGTTINVYSVNNDNLTWVDSNGDFKVSSYDHSMINLDTDLIELNNQSLNDVFNDGNLLTNADFSNGTTGWLTGGASSLSVSNQVAAVVSSVTGYGYIYQSSKQVVNDIYWAYSQVRKVTGTMSYIDYGISSSNTLNNPTTIFTEMYDKYTALETLFLIRGGGTPTYQYEIKNVYLISLTYLGIDNLTKEEMYQYYNLYMSLQQNRIEAYKELGNEPISQWQNLTQIISDIMDAVAGPISDTIDWIDKFMFGLFS